MMAKQHLSFAGLLLLAGCALAPGPSTPAGGATLSLVPRIQAGGFSVQGVVKGYTQADVRHLIVKLFKVAGGGSESEVVGSGGTPVSMDVPGSRFDSPVIFSNLAPDTTYRVRAYAYSDAATASLISNSASYITVTLTKNDRPNAESLPVQLIPVPFSGAATSSAGIGVIDGTVIGTGSVGASRGLVTSLLAGTYAGDYQDGTGAAASFTFPNDIVSDGSGNLYVTDQVSHVIRKIVVSTGAVTTLAGTPGMSGSSNGTGTAARFDQPAGLAYDGAGLLYVADSSNATIRKIDLASKVVTTLAGTSGAPGSANGTGTAAKFNYPKGLALDGSGNLYVADYGNELIRKIVLSSKAVTTFAGKYGTSGNTDASGTSATFNSPFGLVYDGSGNLYVTCMDSYTVRRIVIASKTVSTLAGSAFSSGTTDGAGTVARFDRPAGIAMTPGGDLVVSDLANHTIRRIVPSTQAVTTLAGVAGSPGLVDDLPTRFNYPTGLTVGRSGEIYVADKLNNAIRTIH